jgi:hypothetical protein
MRKIATAIMAWCIFAIGVEARNIDNQWAQADPTEHDLKVQRWYKNLMQPDNIFVSCCGEADAYWADSFEVDGDKYVAIITDTREVPNRRPREVGTKFTVPNHKIKYDAGNPTGHGVIFISGGSSEILCYLAPGGG